MIYTGWFMATWKIAVFLTSNNRLIGRFWPGWPFSCLRQHKHTTTTTKSPMTTNPPTTHPMIMYILSLFCEVDFGMTSQMVIFPLSLNRVPSRQQSTELFFPYLHSKHVSSVQFLQSSSHRLHVWFWSS